MGCLGFSIQVIYRIQASRIKSDLLQSFEISFLFLPYPSSVLLNVLFPVQIASTTYERVASASSGSDSAANEVAATSSPKSVCKLRLTGNPAPNADEINVQAPEGVVDKLETRLDVRNKSRIELRRF